MFGEDSRDNSCFLVFFISTMKQALESHMNKATMPQPSCKVSAFLKRFRRCSFACLEIQVESQVLRFTFVEHLLYLVFDPSLAFLSLVLLFFHRFSLDPLSVFQSHKEVSKINIKTCLAKQSISHIIANATRRTNSVHRPSPSPPVHITRLFTDPFCVSSKFIQCPF